MKNAPRWCNPPKRDGWFYAGSSGLMLKCSFFIGPCSGCGHPGRKSGDDDRKIGKKDERTATGDSGDPKAEGPP